MRTYGIEDIQGYDYPVHEDKHRKSRARQKAKKDIQKELEDDIVICAKCGKQYEKHWHDNNNKRIYKCPYCLYKR